MISFTDVSQERCLHFRPRCIRFLNFYNTYFTESLSITANDSSARISFKGLCNADSGVRVETAEELC